LACPSLTFGRFAVICAVRTVMVERPEVFTEEDIRREMRHEDRRA
jgi:hypothetical protein